MRRGRAFVALAFAAVARPASGAPMGPGVEAAHVLTIDAGTEAYDGVAKTVTNSLRQRVIDADEFAVAGQSPQLVVVAGDAKCAIKRLGRPTLEEDERVFDEACLKKIAARLGARRFFWGFVRPTAGRPSVRLHFWQEGHPDRLAELPYDEYARERVVARLYRKLVSPELVGDLSLSGDVSGDLVVDGRPEGPYVPGVELTLFAGEHAIEVRRGDRVAARTRAKVEVGGRVSARLEPVAELAPSAVHMPNEPPPVKIRPRPSAWPWVLGAAAGAGLAGAGVFWGLRKGERTDLERGCYERDCPPGLEGAADRANLYGTLSAVSLGVGVAAGAGLAAFLLAPSKRPPPVSGAIIPLAGGATAGVAGSF